MLIQKKNQRRSCSARQSPVLLDSFASDVSSVEVICRHWVTPCLPPRYLSFLFMPHPIVEIDELLGLVLDRLFETSPRTTVSLALTCRSLEEPALSLLWQQRCSLPDLVKVLPNHTCVKDERGVELSVVSGRDFPADRVLMSIHPGD